MIVDFDFLGAVSTSGTYVKHIALVPIGIVDLVEAIVAGVKEVLGVHDVVEHGIHLDVGWKIDDLNLHQLQLT